MMRCVLLTIFITAAAWAQSECPCTALPAFNATLYRPLAACTHEPPGQWQFMRAVSPDGWLVATFAFDDALYCGVQASGPQSVLDYLPTDWQEYTICRHLIQLAAHRQGIHCTQETFR